ncbi:hypothetical protein [Massilia polaris]|nr:hypothetical protein [Massilia polaris]
MTLMGCQVDNLTMEETLGKVEGFIQSGRPHQTFADVTHKDTA